VVAGHDVGGRGVAVLDLVRQTFEVRVVGTSFQQKHRTVGVFTQPRGNDGAC